MMQRAFLSRLSLVVGLLALGGCPEDEKGGQDAGNSPDHDANAADASDGARDAGEGDADVDAQANVDAQAPACKVDSTGACPGELPGFADVQPLFQTYCSGCHGKDWSGAWPLDTYSHIADWQFEVLAELMSCAMPPADAGVPLPDDKRAVMMTWLRCGAPK